MSHKKKLVIVITQGFDSERANVAWSIANGGIAANFDVTIFLVSSGVDWVRKNANAVARMNPLDPTIKEMMQTVLENGGTIMACPPCVKVRGYEQSDLMEGVVLAGSVAMLDVVSQGASTLSF
ncbi:MAG: DsrE family protein [Gammaproteobacteria bacterium]|nr:DsrE family protein [Gammaproteobacteria bacterium]